MANSHATTPKNRKSALLEAYLDGVKAAIRSSVGEMLPRRATPDEREHVNTIIDGFAADIIAAARMIDARKQRSRRPKAVSAARRTHLRLIVDNDAGVQP